MTTGDGDEFFIKKIPPFVTKSGRPFLFHSNVMRYAIRTKCSYDEALYIKLQWAQAMEALCREQEEQEAAEEFLGDHE